MTFSILHSWKEFARDDIFLVIRENFQAVFSQLVTVYVYKLPFCINIQSDLKERTIAYTNQLFCHCRAILAVHSFVTSTVAGCRWVWRHLGVAAVCLRSRASIVKSPTLSTGYNWKLRFFSIAINCDSCCCWIDPVPHIVASIRRIVELALCTGTWLCL